MSHPLAPLRHVYDVEPPHASAGDPPTAGDPAETELLREMRRVLEARPAVSPDTSALHAVEARAAAASATAGPLYDAYASSAPLAGEAELLRQSRVLVDRAIASRPQPRPSSDVEALILARAAEASGLARDAAPASPALMPVAAAYGLATATGAEAALARSTRDALDRLPTRQPDAATLDAILAQAALASSPAAAPPAAPDRAAAPAAHRRRRTGGVWVGSAALLAAAVVAFVVFPFGDAGLAESEVSPQAVPLVAQADAEPVARDATDERVEEEAPEASAPLAAAPTPQLVQRSAPRGPAASEFAPVRAERSVASSQPAPELAAPAEAAVELADAAPAPPSGTPPEWEMSDDVRLLSLRLQELRRQNQGVTWDQPAEAFGARPSAGGTQPGIQAVREGAAPVRAQIRVRSDSARSNR